MDNTPFYPNQGYLKRNLAPELFSTRSLEALAKAENLARAKGVLSSNLANALLPNALVEGWNNFGIVDGRYGYPPNKRRDQVMENMGLRVVNSDAPEVLKKYADMSRDTVGGYQLFPHAGLDASAKLATALLAEKAHLYGEDKAIERWNGKGRATEEYYGDYVQADAKNHARKVQMMVEMLKHPANREISTTYQKLRGY